MLSHNEVCKKEFGDWFSSLTWYCMVFVGVKKKCIFITFKYWTQSYSNSSYFNSYFSGAGCILNMPMLECLVDHLGSVSCCLMKSRSLQWNPDGETGSLAMTARSSPYEISPVCMHIQNSISWKSQTNQVALRFLVTGLNTGKRFILPWGNKHFLHTSILAQKGLAKQINSVNRIALGNVCPT